MNRVADDLNAALHKLFEADPSAYLLGEDVADPYGGAFKITKGLTTRFPGRVRATPISEAGFTGVACGLALTGNTVIVEIMFADFLFLALDQIVNFAAKSVSMYGRRLPMRLIVRCPTGGRRGYGATHSQSPQKHLIGVPDLAIYELSPLHPAAAVFAEMTAAAIPCLFVEDKSLYGERLPAGDRLDDLFSFDRLGTHARAYADRSLPVDHLVLAPGGMLGRTLAAARRLLLDREENTQIVVPSRLYPLDLDPLLPLLTAAGRVSVVEESTAGGTWGEHVAARINAAVRLRHPVTLVSSADSIIPAAPQLEAQVVAGADTIYAALATGPLA
ncbi:alpha-ketoacid dehydrogenase subunit beta [Hamadaea tsunoensis]|uniref:alpha-ketoacid dehydrogenase subunit beta n=1 Tax=Hamadaea tsunoensis TaxID=53368 RepID=UPI0004886078|nr:transketolase C-terminal domain-containing protein [Hamadaea tsunoensis]